ncbi:MAG: ATP-binding protein, partial [Cellvibrio sp.]|uniref:ATP-binding protein n=1 Tax=Cellvibrio sp. TaxID=1965322 RepID=UPI0031A2EAAD
LTLMVGPLEDALADSDEPLGDAQRKRLEVTHRNSLRLLKLVNALLDFSRIEAGRAKGNFAATDLAQLTEDLSGVFRSAIEKAGLRYEVTVTDLGEDVYIDRDMWEKIVFNLLSNAFKFTFSGSIGVTLKRIEGFARLEISDTGSGIAEEELPRVFERFHRIENSKGRTYEGTGIGLAMIQELVKLHKGKIGVTSEPGEGSTFYVEIPFGTAHVPLAELAGANNQGNAVFTTPADTLGTSFIQEALGWLPEEQQEKEGLPPRPTVQSIINGDATPIRILLADDNSDMRGYLKRLMENYASVETCGDGEAAYQAICRERPDLVVSDVMMPVLDGFGLIEKVRNNEAIKDVPIILLSARAGEEAKIEGLAAGADDYLVKPFSANELLSRVKYQVDAARRRQAAQSELALSEKYFRSLVDASTAIIWTCDATGYCTFLSKRWGEVTGRDTSLDLGFGWIDNVHPDDQPHTRDMFLSAQQSLVPFNIIYRLRHANGDYRWAVDSGAPLFENGALTGFVGTVVDVHDERVAKDSMEVLANDLTEINQRQNEFLVTLAHELRNPLAPIRNGLEIMRLSTSANQPANNVHQMMDRQVKHLTHLVDDLLDIARITKGKINLKKEPVALKTILTNAVEISMPLIEASHHELVVNIREQDVTIDVDPHRITQVISNILNNAAKYTPNGGKIVVSTFAEEDVAVLTVEDNGIGLSPEAVSTVFNLFSQIQTEVDRAQGGLGIGLHLVKRLVDLHDGSVAVTSPGKGQGSTFSIRLPRIVTEKISQNVATDTPTENTTALHILIVDDNRDGAETLATLMQYCGHTAYTAGNGKDALALAADTLPDIVFLDIGLPDMSGYEVAVEMRKIAKLKHSRFVALTGRGAESDKAQAIAVGFDYHLTKPASLEKLNEILSSSPQK